MARNGYWLASWLDENEIRSQQSARRYLKDPKHVEELLATISAIDPATEPLERNEITTIVAGSTIDLSGELGCYHHECLQKDVDKLFTRAWHYFDLIIVEGLVPRHAATLLKGIDDDQSLERFLGFIENFFYVRKIGAEDMLLYQQKQPACVQHLRQHAEQCDATSILEEREAWIDGFSPQAKVTSLRQHEDHWHYTVTHPNIEHIALGSVRAADAKGHPSESEIYGAVFDQYAAVLVSDIYAARTMRAPLGAAAMIHERLLSETSGGSPTVQDALFSLELPVVAGLTAKDLIKIRRDNWQYFDAFQLALRNAAKEYLAGAVDGTRPVEIATQIQDDIIEPELVKIRRELRVSADTLTRKSALSLPLGTLATTIGLLDKAPLAAAGVTTVVAAASIGSFLIDYKKYIDDKRGVLTSDMYFLWRAQRIADHKKR